MRISRRGEYGLTAILYLASQPSGKLSLSEEIAGECGIPKNFLAQILARLRRKGILGSVRGKRGASCTIFCARPLRFVTSSPNRSQRSMAM